MATIKDVARLAGVGVGTASRVVSGKGSVAAATAERVRKAIETLEFRPSHAARSLLSGSSQTIGVYIPVLKGTFFTPILQAIDTELRAVGRHMVVSFGSGDGDARQQAINGVEFLTERGCDGLVIVSSALLESDLQALGAMQSKVVVLSHSYPGMSSQCFTADHVQGGTLAAQLLLEHSHRELAVISGPSTSPDNVARIAGFMGELQRQGQDLARVVTLGGDFSPAGGWVAAQALLDAKRPVTAVFCANDEMAVGAMSRFQQAGVIVPQQLSVLGYDDTQSAEYSAPPLTSIHVPWRDITIHAVRWLMNQCYATTFEVQRSFPVSVTTRASLQRCSR